MKRLKKWLAAKTQIKWPAFGPTVDMESCLNIYASKVIRRVSTAMANGGDENLHKDIKEELKNVFFTGGQIRIEKMHRRVRDLEIDIRGGIV
jgi:hypothetical protein